MPLILAIEPDKRQSTQLATVVKGLQAELIQRSTAADGLDALQGRVPDLVLTSSLISPRDDSALAGHLRELGAAAAHVQTVTIPLLGSAAPTRAKGGMLAALRRQKPPEAPMTDGCAPDVFADQIRQYLATAEEQKASAATRVAAAPDSDVAEDAVALTGAPPFEPPMLEPTVEVADTWEADAAIEAAAPFEPMLAVEAVAAPEPVETEPAAAVALALELEPVAVPEPIEDFVEPAIFEAEALIAGEPAGLPLSQLLQLVSATAPSLEAAEPVRTAASVEASTVDEFSAEFEERGAAAEEPDAPIVEAAVFAETEEVEPAAGFDEIFIDPVAAQALEELSRQAPQASLADGIPSEVPVPVVEMRSFQSLDDIASELAARPSRRHESLDDLASLFAAAPAPKASRDDSENDVFASLFAKPTPARQAEPIVVPGIDPSLFASAPAVSLAFEPVAATSPAFEIESFEPFEPVAEREPIFEATAEPIAEAIAEPIVEARSEPVAAVPAPIVVEPEPEVGDSFPAFEPVTFEPQPEEPAAAAAAPICDEEISLDVDWFTAALAEPEPPALPEPSRFSFTFVDGFGDALSDFEVPSVAAGATDLGVGEHSPVDPYAEAHTRVTASVRESAGHRVAAPALDEEALSMIGDAARKVGLDALVIEEFERGLPVRRVKKAKKKPHVPAAPLPAPAAERAAKPATRPVQDEWGMFDPEQCGFAALEDEEGTENRTTSGTRVRVISY